MTIVVAAAFLVWTGFAYGSLWFWILAAVAAIALIAGWLANARGAEGVAFTLLAVTVAAAVFALFASLFPDVMPASNDPANSLTIANASSSTYTLTVMSWLALIALPLVLLYQGWTYWVFRKRVSGRRSRRQCTDVKPLDPRLVRRSRASRAFLLAGGGLALLQAASIIAFAWALSMLVTGLIDGIRMPRAWPLLVMLVVAASVRALAAWAWDLVGSSGAMRVKAELRTELLTALESRPTGVPGFPTARVATLLGAGLDALDAYFGTYLPQLVLTVVATPVLIVDGVDRRSTVGPRARDRAAAHPDLHGADRHGDRGRATSAVAEPGLVVARIPRGRGRTVDARGVRSRRAAGRPHPSSHR